MGALTIAFDTILAGALALPWVVLLIHLFCFEGENHVGRALKWVKEQEQPAAAGVLLFAMAYTLGSAVTRIAQDFFNDGDLRVQLRRHLLHEGVTEDRILTRVYCGADDDRPAAGRGGKSHAGGENQGIPDTEAALLAPSRRADFLQIRAERRRLHRSGG